MASYKTIFFILGILITILGFSMLIPYSLQIILNESNHSFLTSSVITIVAGILMVLTNIDEDHKLNLQETFLLSTLSWLMIAVFGSLPFIFSNLGFSFTHSFFESMSGITTTGSTVISDLDNTDKSILLWRAILQWLGGIGIIVMAITILPLLKVGGMQFFKMDNTHSAEKILPRTIHIASSIITIYLILTIACGLLYWFFGMSIFDSIAHSFTTIATGGFSTHNQSIGFFESSQIEIVATIFILLGSLPFIAYLKFLKGDRKIFLNDVQIKGLFFLLFLSISIMFIYLLVQSTEISIINKLRVASFNVVSILSGTGYVTDDFSVWGKFPLIFFLILMFIGGCAGSTTCGLKIFRIQLLLIYIKNNILKYAYPNRVILVKYNNQTITDNFLTSVVTFIFAFIFLFIFISTLLSVIGLDFVTAISGAATSISNVGPGLGDLIGPDGNFSNLPDAALWIISAGMLLGRLELFAVLILLFPSFWRG